MGWVDAILLLVTVLSGVALIFTPSGRKNLANFLAGFTGGAIDVAGDLATSLSPALLEIEKAIAQAIETHGGAIKSDLTKPFGDLAAAALATVTASLEKNRDVTPPQAAAIAGEAMSDAFGFGLSSFSVAAAFEAIFPEKLNVLNGTAPMLATMSGFEEITKAVLGPTFDEGIATPSRYDAASKFRAHLPNLEDAAFLHARGLITEAEYEKLAAYNGIAPAYSAPIRDGAYRAISAFQMIRALETGVLSNAEVQDELTFAGLRPASIDRMKRVAAALALAPYKQQALAAAINAFERGTLSNADFGNTLAQFNLPDGAEQFIQLTAAYRKLEQLAELYRKSVSEAYLYGEVSDADYLPRLEAIGIAAPDAEAHYAVDSIKKRGKAELAAARDQARQEALVRRTAVAAAHAEYLAGRLNEATLALALEAAGEPPGLVAGQVALLEARRLGRMVRVYNLLLSKEDAALLKDQVAAIEEQTLKQLITAQGARGQLESLGLNRPFAEALASKWAAQATKTVLPA